MIEIEAQNELTCARVGKLKSHLSKKNLQIKFVPDLWRFQNTYFLIKQSGKTSTIIVSVLHAFSHKESLVIYHRWGEGWGSMDFGCVTNTFFMPALEFSRVT